MPQAGRAAQALPSKSDTTDRSKRNDKPGQQDVEIVGGRGYIGGLIYSPGRIRESNASRRAQVVEPSDQRGSIGKRKRKGQITPHACKQEPKAAKT